MIWNIYNIKKEKVGTIRAGGAMVSVDETSTKLFLDFTRISLEKGITRFKEVYDHTKNALVLAEEPVDKNDPNFALAFKKFLESSGYEVTEEHPEALAELESLMHLITDSGLAEKLNAELSSFSYLEQTVFLETLRALAKPQNSAKKE